MGEDVSAWIGRSERTADILDPARSNALRAALGESEALPLGAPLPLLHHWLYFWNARVPAELGIDGHPARGGFLPPVPLPRRMWAGGRLHFIQPLRIGEIATRTSTVTKVEAKHGRSGDLVFVTVAHEISGEKGPAVIEEQDIVYRTPDSSDGKQGGVPDVPCEQALWRRDVMPDAVLLFRYSALTMNGHRIHYDRRYAIDEEGYPGLVVHGPLQATLLADLAASHIAAPITTFDYRGRQAAFDGILLRCSGSPIDGGVRLWTDQGAGAAMVATATFGQEARAP